MNKQQPLIERGMYHLRNLRINRFFDALERYCNGAVLDVGGWDFIFSAKDKGIKFAHWTTLEPDLDRKIEVEDRRFSFVHGNGCSMDFPDNSFDTVINMQVLEHVYEPIKMVNEIARVLKVGGHAIFLIPQTSTIHATPDHYYNFTRFWIEKAMRNAKLEIIMIKPLGGVWSSMASHLVYFFLQSARYTGMSYPECSRNIMFYILFPFMVLYALLSIPICLILSLGDLSEEPNNHLVVVKKR